MLFVGSMSFQESFKRLKSNEIVSIHPHVCSLCRNKLQKSPEENTERSFDKVVSQSFLEILDSILRFQRFTVKKSFVLCCISDKSVLQCWSSFSGFKLCKIQPVIDELLILEPRS